jgi:hypothetical protein
MPCWRQSGRRSDMKLCAKWRILRAQCILRLGDFGGQKAFAPTRAAGRRWNRRRRHNWKMTSLTLTRRFRTGVGSSETISRSRIFISLSSGAWAFGLHRAHAIFRISIVIRWRLRAFRRRGVPWLNRESLWKDQPPAPGKTVTLDWQAVGGVCGAVRQAVGQGLTTTVRAVSPAASAQRTRSS